MFQRIKNLFPASSSRKKNSSPAEKSAFSTRYVLVLSGGGTRGFYTLGVLKALEESGLKPQIDALYGISVGAIIAAYRAAGRTAPDIFERFKDINISAKNRINLLPTKHFLKTTLLQEYFKKDLPQTFEALQMQTFIGATDMYTAQLILFQKGDLLEPLLGSMALPGIFPSVKYQNYLLNDGGIVDNFPTTLAKQQYPRHKIIGVALNKFKEDKHPKNLIETLMTAYEILMRKDLVKRSQEIDIAFYEILDCGILELNKNKRKKAFEQGYNSGMEKFATL